MNEPTKKEPIITAYLITKDKAEKVTIKNGLEGFYEALQCHVIDIQERYIRGRLVDFVIDDEGRMTDDYIIPAWSNDTDEYIAGRLLICGCGASDGEEHSLTEEDIAAIEDAIIYAQIFDDCASKDLKKKLCAKMLIYSVWGERL